MAIRKKDIKLAVNRNRIKRKIKGSFRSKVLELQKKDYVVFGLIRRSSNFNTQRIQHIFEHPNLNIYTETTIELNTALSSINDNAFII